MKLAKGEMLSQIVRKNMAWFILIVLCVIFYILSPNFLTVRNVINILSQNAYVIVAALGVGCIMMSGAIDLSVGYQISVCVIISAMLMINLKVPPVVATVLVLLLSIGLSMMNEFLTQKLKLTMMLVTIATMTIFQGASYVISNSKSFTGFPDSFKYLGQGLIFDKIPFPIILTLVFFLLVSFILNRTYFGRYIYALGGNEEAARLAGINVNQVRFIIAAMSGFFIGLAALMLVARVGTANSALGPGTEFTVITGVLLGGVSVRGGEGKMSGIVAGVLIIAILSNGMQLAGMNVFYQYIAKGIIMLAAIGVDEFQMSHKKIKKAEKTA